MDHTIRKITLIIIRKIRSIICRIENQCQTVLLYRLKRKGSKIQNCFITCSGKRDGVGAQTQAILSTMLFAQEFRLTYIHTPFGHIGYRLDENWEEQWEEFLNLGKGEMSIDEIQGSSLSVVHINHPRKFRNELNTIYIIPHCHDFADRYPNRYSSMTERFIEKYMASLKSAYDSFYETGKINIAVHVRRGDVSKENLPKRYTENIYYESLLHSIISILDDLNAEVSVHLYSQGSIEDFHELKELNVNYHLEEDAFTTFYNLTSADILIMAKSSYSYSAALLSKAIKIYEPFWHKPLDDWIVTNWSEKNKQVIFEESSLKQKVQSLLTRM